MNDQEFVVIWTLDAARDLREIVAYVAKHSPQNARSILDRIRKKASALSRFPQRGRVVPELRYFGIYAYRELIVRPYRIVYRISDDRVVVLAVLDSRRDLEDVLLERLVRE